MPNLCTRRSINRSIRTPQAPTMIGAAIRPGQNPIVRVQVKPM